MEPMLVVEIVRWVGAAAALGRKRRKVKRSRDSQCCMAEGSCLDSLSGVVLVSVFFLGGDWFSLSDLMEAIARRILSKFSECLSSFVSMDVLNVLWDSLSV